MVLIASALLCLHSLANGVRVPLIFASRCGYVAAKVVPFGKTPEMVKGPQLLDCKLFLLTSRTLSLRLHR